MQPVLMEFLANRRDRACAIILGVKERECDKQLSPDARAKLRKVVLDQLNDFYDVAMDIMKSLDSGETVLNEEWLSKLDEIHMAVVGG
jgi:hypothetical protein